MRSFLAPKLKSKVHSIHPHRELVEDGFSLPENDGVFSFFTALVDDKLSQIESKVFKRCNALETSMFAKIQDLSSRMKEIESSAEDMKQNFTQKLIALSTRGTNLAHDDVSFMQFSLPNYAVSDFSREDSVHPSQRAPDEFTQHSELISDLDSRTTQLESGLKLLISEMDSGLRDMLQQNQVENFHNPSSMTAAAVQAKRSGTAPASLAGVAAAPVLPRSRRPSSTKGTHPGDPEAPSGRKKRDTALAKATRALGLRMAKLEKKTKKLTTLAATHTKTSSSKQKQLDIKMMELESEVHVVKSSLATRAPSASSNKAAPHAGDGAPRPHTNQNVNSDVVPFEPLVGDPVAPASNSVEATMAKFETILADTAVMKGLLESATRNKTCVEEVEQSVKGVFEGLEHTEKRLEEVEQSLKHVFEGMRQGEKRMEDVEQSVKHVAEKGVGHGEKRAFEERKLAEKRGEDVEQSEKRMVEEVGKSEARTAVRIHFLESALLAVEEKVKVLDSHVLRLKAASSSGPILITTDYTLTQSSTAQIAADNDANVYQFEVRSQVPHTLPPSLAHSSHLQAASSQQQQQQQQPFTHRQVTQPLLQATEQPLAQFAQLPQEFGHPKSLTPPQQRPQGFRPAAAAPPPIVVKEVQLPSREPPSQPQASAELLTSVQQQLESPTVPPLNSRVGFDVGAVVAVSTINDTQSQNQRGVSETPSPSAHRQMDSSSAAHQTRPIPQPMVQPKGPDEGAGVASPNSKYGAVDQPSILEQKGPSKSSAIEGVAVQSERVMEVATRNDAEVGDDRAGQNTNVNADSVAVPAETVCTPTPQGDVDSSGPQQRQGIAAPCDESFRIAVASSSDEKSPLASMGVDPKLMTDTIPESKQDPAVTSLGPEAGFVAEVAPSVVEPWDEAVQRESISALKAEVAELGERVKLLNKDKVKSKKEIKAWMTEFEATNGRQPYLAEKEAMKHLFEMHLTNVKLKDEAENSLQALQTQLSEMQKEFDEKVANARAAEGAATTSNQEHDDIGGGKSRGEVVSLGRGELEVSPQDPMPPTVAAVGASASTATGSAHVVAEHAVAEPAVVVALTPIITFPENSNASVTGDGRTSQSSQLQQSPTSSSRFPSSSTPATPATPTPGPSPVPISKSNPMDRDMAAETAKLDRFVASKARLKADIDELQQKADLSASDKRKLDLLLLDQKKAEKGIQSTETTLKTLRQRADVLANVDALAGNLEGDLPLHQAETPIESGFPGAAPSVGGNSGGGVGGGDGGALTGIAGPVIDMATMAAKIEEEEAKLKRFSDAKTRLKKEIREWVKNFEKDNSREPSVADKQEIKHLFLDHKRAEKMIESAEASLAVLRRERSGVSGAAVDERVAQLKALNDTKSQLKKEIKTWTKDFEKENGREPTIAEKQQIKHLFVDYKKVETEIKNLESS